MLIARGRGGDAIVTVAMELAAESRCDEAVDLVTRAMVLLCGARL